MYITYLVQNDGQGVVGPATFDFACLPSECFWLIPGTEDLDPYKDVPVLREYANG